MITANRFRHATDEERRMGHGPMKARRVTYDLNKAEILEQLQDVLMMQEDDDARPATSPEQIHEAIGLVSVGRPIRESLLKSMLGEAALRAAFLSAEPDAVFDAEDMIKSQRETDDVYEVVTVLCDEYVGKSERTMYGSGPFVREQVQCFLPSVADLRDRLRKAFEAGHPVVRDTDMGLLGGGAVREPVLRALYPETTLEQIAEGDDLGAALARTRRAVVQVAGEPLSKSVSTSEVRPEAAEPVAKAYRGYVRDLQARGGMAAALQAAAELKDLLARKGAWK